MTSQSRIDGFSGNDSKYIVYLESLARRAIPTYALPSPPCSVVRSEAYTDCDTVDDTFEAGLGLVKFILYEPELSFAKRRRLQPRWEREMDYMLHDLSVFDWSVERKRVGLASLAKILAAFDIVIGNKPRTQLAVCDTVTCYNALNAVL